MRRATTLIFLSILIPLFAIWQSGCQHSDSPTSSNEASHEPDWPENAVGLPEEDSRVLDSAMSLYIGMLDSLDPVDARHALVAQLSASGSGIDWVKPGRDSVTISVEFTDGISVVLMTDEIMFSGLGKVAMTRMLNHGMGMTGSQSVAREVRRLMDCGESATTPTATLRWWQEGDQTEPTGDPIPGKQVDSVIFEEIEYYKD